MRVVWIEQPASPKQITRSRKNMSIDDFMNDIGKRVAKRQNSMGSQPKPFKSKSKVNTVKDVIIHPIMWEPAYTFIEDDSFVLCRQCYVITDEKLEYAE